LATGGTIGAAAELVRQQGGEIIELAFLIELTALKGRERLMGLPVFSLIQY
jgi:adenine phosphoribosyltransferase